MAEDERFQEPQLRPDTRVLFYVKDRDQYLMTNERDKPLELLRVFAVDRHWMICMHGYLLGSIFAHDPYIIPELEAMDCTFEELNPTYFS